jgi:putative sigma-54 modulation protein
MKCSVTFRHLKASDPIRQYAEEKVDKLSRLIDRGGEAQVTLSVEKHLHVCHVELVTDGSLRIRGVNKSEDMYASIDAAVERIVRQVKRYRDKIQNHRPNNHIGRELAQQVLEVEEVEEAPQVPKVVRQETIVARTMSLDDAMMQMDLLNEDFLVFTNALSHKVNVLYRLPDGQYGLIEPHAAA